jgi:XTP/dITP diphosphohydrolase
VSRIVLATGNVGKLREMRAMLPGFDVAALSDFTGESAVESGLTFVENAIIKARHACAASGLPAIADDSGLEVDALGGEPGIHSARYAGEHGDDQANIDKLLRELEGVTDRSARFRCVIVAMRHTLDPAPLICAGVWEGAILHTPRGSSGFGYDPVFHVMDSGQSAAELSPAGKNRRSHRGQALDALKGLLSSARFP